MSVPAAMLEQAFDLPRQLVAGIAAGDAAGMADRRPAAVALCGLGGSAAGGRLLTAMFAKCLAVPVVVVDGTTLPAWVGEEALVVCVSYSGRTAETLALWDAAGARGALRAAVTAGGELAERAAASGAPCALVEAGFQPRGALGLLLGALAGLLDRAGVIPGAATELAAAVPGLERAVAAERAALEGSREEAARLVGRAVVLYGSGARAAAAARLKNQINENAKAAAWAGAMPEVAHNEILGWIGVARRALPVVAVFLRDPDEPAAERSLHDRLQALVAGDAPDLLEWRGAGATELERTLALLVHGDAVSCLVAEADGVDALDIARLEALKAPAASG